jgi:23S rRNA (cytosine1962-C5)-methyltransferase
MTTAKDVLSTLLKRIQDNEHCMRVLHGRGKCYPGYELINVEWYPPYLFVQNFGDELSSEQQSVFKELFESVKTIDALLVQSREWPNFKTEVFCSRKEIELPLVFEGKLKNNLHCEIKLGANRNTGVFLDMRSGWDWVANNSRNKRVLNLFSYTSVFSLFALSGGASRVDNVDMAANVLKISQRNHQSNGLHDGRAAFFKRDILKSQRWFEGRDPYDLMILDPPPYQKKAFRGWQDYLKLLDNAKIALAEQGVMLCCLNNPQATIDEFILGLKAHFNDAISFSIIERADEIEEQQNEKGLKLVAIQF